MPVSSSERVMALCEGGVAAFSVSNEAGVTSVTVSANETWSVSNAEGGVGLVNGVWPKFL